jgi:hypothetical protein
LEDEKFDLEYAVKKKDFEVEFGFLLQVEWGCATLSLPWYIHGLRFQVHVPTKANAPYSFLLHRIGFTWASHASHAPRLTEFSPMNIIFI